MTVIIPIATASAGGGSSTSDRRVLGPVHEITQPEVDAAIVHLLNPDQAKSEVTTQIWVGGILITLGVGSDARFDPPSGDLSWDAGEMLYRVEAGMPVHIEYETP